jgi:hypothetical protein
MVPTTTEGTIRPAQTILHGLDFPTYHDFLTIELLEAKRFSKVYADISWFRSKRNACWRAGNNRAYG